MSRNIKVTKKVNNKQVVYLLTNLTTDDTMNLLTLVKNIDNAKYSSANSGMIITTDSLLVIRMLDGILEVSGN